MSARLTITLLTIALVGSSSAHSSCVEDLGPAPRTRTTYQDPHIVLRSGDLVITTKRVYWKRQNVKLSADPRNTDNNLRRMLIALADRANSYVSLDDLIEDVWPEAYENSELENPISLAQTTISYLRGAFKEVDPEFNQLVNRPKVGYALVTSESAMRELNAEHEEPPIIWRGQIVKLSPCQRSLYRALLERSPQVISKRELFRVLKRHSIDPFQDHDEAKLSSKLTVQISLLRSAFKKVDPHFSALQTFSEVGYAWSVLEDLQ